jgi:uncharacterized phage protein (TIGR02220 family)
MTLYRRVSPRLWGDEKFRLLSAPAPSAQWLWIFLICGPHTGRIPGLFHAGEAALAEALGWPLRTFRKHFSEIEALGMARADWTARLVFLPNAVKHNPPQSVNVVKGWRAEFDELPDCPLKRAAVAEFRAFLSTFTLASHEGSRDAFLQAFGEAIPEGMAYKQLAVAVSSSSEQKQYPPKSPQGGTCSPSESALSWLECLNQQTARQFKATPGHLRHIRARIAEGYSLEQAERVVKHKVAEWQGTEYAKYLRPETVFGPKFGGYVEAAADSNGHHAPPKRSGIAAAWEGQPEGEAQLP